MPRIRFFSNNCRVPLEGQAYFVRCHSMCRSWQLCLVELAIPRQRAGIMIGVTTRIVISVQPCFPNSLIDGEDIRPTIVADVSCTRVACELATRLRRLFTSIPHQEPV